MTHEVNPWTVAPAVAPAPQPGPPPPIELEPRRLRPGLVLALFLALGASIGLALWLSGPDRLLRATSKAPSLGQAAAPPAPQPLRFASPDPIPGQVRAAYDEVRSIYVNGGPDALVKASADCARRLQLDPTRLDECLAIDAYAADIVPADGSDDSAAAWFHEARPRDVALARSALPAEIDAAERVDQVKALTTSVLPRPKLHRVQPPAHKRSPVHHAAPKRAPAKHGPRPHRTAVRTPARPIGGILGQLRVPAPAPADRAYGDPGPDLQDQLPPH